MRASALVALAVLMAAPGPASAQWRLFESDFDEEKPWTEIEAKLPSYPKRKRFTQKELELDQFIERQLNDTRYISRKAREYLQCLMAEPHHVLCPKGSHTETFRWLWGLNTVLRCTPLRNRTIISTATRSCRRTGAEGVSLIASVNMVASGFSINL